MNKKVRVNFLKIDNIKFTRLVFIKLVNKFN